MAITLEDITISFSLEEWWMLTMEQRQLYCEMLQENYRSLVYVGLITSEDFSTWLENNKHLRLLPRLIEDPPSPPPPPSPPSPPLPPPPPPSPETLPIENEEPSQMDIDSCPEQVGPCKSICKEEDTDCSEDEGHPEQPCVSATEQESVPDSDVKPPTILMEQESVPDSDIKPPTVSMKQESVPDSDVKPPTVSMEQESVPDSDVKPPTVSMEQESVPDSDVKPPTVSMEQASGHMRLEGMRLEDILRPCYVWVELLPIPVPVVPVPVVVPEKLQSRSMTTLPQRDFATGVEHPVEQVRPADATFDENCASTSWQAAAPAPACYARKMQNTRPSPLEAPTEKRKLYVCAWCKEPFRLQINLEVHYRYCHQKQMQQLKPLLKAEETRDEQEASGSSSTGDSAASALLPQNPAQHSSSDDGKGVFLHFGPGQPQQRVVKHNDMYDASRGASKSQRNLMATVCAMKKLFRCPECGEKFVYKWQLMSHLRGCKSDVEEVFHLPPQPQGLAATGVPNSAETQEPCFAPAARPSTSQDSKTLYSCDKCGKNISRCYASTHRAFHGGIRFKCLWCGKVFHYRSGAKRHQKLHGKKDESLICLSCGKSAGANGCFCMIEKIFTTADSNDEEQVMLEEETK